VRLFHFDIFNHRDYGEKTQRAPSWVCNVLMYRQMLPSDGFIFSFALVSK